MTKTTSIVLLSILAVIILFVGVFTFIPDGLEYGNYNVYYSPLHLIQKSGMFTDSVHATYQAKYDEDVTFKNIKSVITSRLQSIYGYYSVDVYEKDGVLAIDMPKTSNENNSSANSILSSITQQGKLEILKDTFSSSQITYSESNVVLTIEHFRRVRTQSYVDGENRFYICEAKLTKEGLEAAKKAGLSEGNLYWYAIDESAVYAARYQSGAMQIYGLSKENSKVVASYIKYGSLGAELTLEETIDVENKLDWLALVIIGVAILATLVFFAVRYRTFGIAAILSQLIATVLFVIALGLIYLSMLNIVALIGIILVYALMTAMTIYTFEKIRKYSAEKAFGAARYKGFYDTYKVNLIVHAAVLVLGIILWAIPTFITAPLGTVLVYGAILSFVATFGLNRLFVKMLEPFYEETSKSNARK